MPHDLDPPPAGAAVTAAPAAPRAEPDDLARARRILGGDIRPDDYLPEPEEVRRDAAEHIRQIEEEHGFETAPEAVRHLLNEWTLLHHHDGDTVLAKYTDRGVLVLAAGSQRIYQINQQFDPDYRSGFALMFPSTAW